MRMDSAALPTARRSIGRRIASTAVVGTVAVAVSVGANVPTQAAPAPSWVDQLVEECPDLYVLGIQGTGESSPDAPVKADTGMLSNVMSPFLDKARESGASVDRAYVPYPAGFGGAVPGGQESYAESVSTAEANLMKAAKEVLGSCDATKLGVVAYSQGAHAASEFLKQVGKGLITGIPSTKIASAALFGSPTRAEGAGVFPGTQQSAPDPVPGTSGDAVEALPAVVGTPATGAGFAPLADIADGFGALSGRVSMWCDTGDLACDAPPDAPIAHAIANVAGQAEVGGDPFVAVQSIGLALASTAFHVGVDVINEDIEVPQNSLKNLSIDPKKTLSQRLAEASDPRSTPPTGQEALSALMKVGLVAANAAITVAKKVITPATIAAVSAVGLANPVAAFGIIAAKTAGAVIDLIPPATTQRVVKQTFELVKDEVKANKDLFDLAALTKYSAVQASHTSYASSSATAKGLSPTDYVAKMLAAAAADLAADDVASADVTDSATPTTSTTTPTTTTVVSSPSTSSSSTTSGTEQSTTTVSATTTAQVANG